MYKSFFSLSRIGYFSFFMSLIVGIILGSLLQKNNYTSQKTNTVWVGIQKKLYDKPNNFALHSTHSLVPVSQAAESYDNAKAYIVIDEDTGNIIKEKNSNLSLSIASLTKIMTAVVALDLAKPDSLITISKNAASMQPTKIGIVPGQKMSVNELLHAMLMTSANDAAQAVADGIDISYKQPIFIQAMNEKARFLGLKDTHFANAEGFDDANNKSSAHDLAILATYAMKNYPLISQITAKNYIQLPSTSRHKQFDLYNWNGLLGVYPGVSGVKIGNTDNAGYTTIVRSTRNGHTILAVLLGAPGIIDRDMWTSLLLDDAFFQQFQLPRMGITSQELENKYASWRYW